MTLAAAEAVAVIVTVALAVGDCCDLEKLAVAGGTP